ncbi:MAG: elongation factor G [Bacteroidales bacterium]|nr:elongation factor G [Bacteroidales bacterium]
MKTYQTDQVRNIVLIGNSGSGKTTLAEAMAFEGGIIDRKGSIEAKNTISDYNEIEQQNENSIFSTLLYTEYQDKKINILDTPGLDDFVGGVVSSLSPADLCVMVINAQNGVEVGTEVTSRYVEKFQKPMMIVVNHLDHDKANFEKTLESIQQSFGAKIITIQYPISTGKDFTSIIDLVKMKMLKYPAGGGTPDIIDIPSEEKAKAEELHSALIEKAAEAEESLMEIFFEKETLTEDEMRQGIAKGIATRDMCPIFCTSAKNSIGIGRLLEFICNLAPAPNGVPGMKTKDGKEIMVDPSKPASLFVFKSSIETHIGEINYFKVLTGEITEGLDVTNNTNRTKERLSQIFVSAGKNRTKVTKLAAGDIGATVKLKNTKTNHTLGVPSASYEIEQIQFPEPKYRTAIKPLSEGDEEKLGEALNRMHQEDPTIVIEYSKELKQIIISGQGEYHLNILKWHLDNVFKLNTEFIPPKIPYRETITKIAQAEYRHKKQSGGAGQFGEVHMVIEPYVEGVPAPTNYKVEGKEIKVSVRGTEEIDLSWGGKLVFVNSIVGGSIDTRFHPAILKGVMEKMEEGPLTGSYARDIRVCIYDGKMHPVDSNEISFRLAGRNAFRDAFKKAGPKILEPIYLVEVSVPSERMGDVMSDLQGRRAIVQGMSSEKGYEKIIAKVPLAEMNKYSTSLSSLTGGRAIYTMKFSEYAQVPGDIQEQLLKAYEEEQKEE